MSPAQMSNMDALNGGAHATDRYSGRDCDAPAVYRSTLRKARKEHQCLECGDTIKKGESYEYVTACYDGRWSEFKTCVPCVGIANSLGGRFHGRLQEDYYARFGQDYHPSMRDDVKAK